MPQPPPFSREMLLSRGPPGTQGEATVARRWRLLLGACLHGHLSFSISLSLFPPWSLLTSLPRQPKPKSLKSLSQNLLFREPK